MDGIDGVLCSINPNGQAEVLVHTSAAFSSDLKTVLHELQAPTHNELHKEALAANQLAQEYALIVHRILELASLTPKHIVAIGAHGQTIRHQPILPNGVGYSLQCLNGALLAELTGIDVINDFRNRDIAAQGHGAPLVPAFHHSQFGNSDYSKAILNLGGIANLTLLKPNQPILGFDTGPGNLLLDAWIYKNKHLNYDHQGNWGRSGQVDTEILQILMNEPYFSSPIPKSTGRDLFNLNWLLNTMSLCSSKPSAEDIQATLVALTAKTVVSSLFTYLPDCQELIVCGGGTKNLFLLESIARMCKEHTSSFTLMTAEELGLDSQTIEGMAFAWLAWCFTSNTASNIPEVTGAKGPRILGSLHRK
ncbi:anhydro-N-acetylmuramic acid kinase [Polynucleobacter sp. SHI2]|nr:anhydro-N-acetylmuramic acid kinase [Polynucleobacter sp. SHI2]